MLTDINYIDDCQRLANTHCGENVTIHKVTRYVDGMGKVYLSVIINEKKRIDYLSFVKALYTHFKLYIKLQVASK